MDKEDFQEIVELYQSGKKGVFPAHSFENHVMKVYENMQKIISGEDVDRDVLQFATLLHDIGRYYDGEGSHAERGAEKAREFLLNELDRSEAFVDKVCECIRNHSNRPGVEPPTREAELLWVADKMHLTGATGLCRFLLTFGARGYSCDEAADAVRTRLEYMEKRFEKYGFGDLVPELGIIKNFVKKYSEEKRCS